MTWGKTWTTERIDKLKALYENGAQYSGIAIALGISRNAVAGQVFRLVKDKSLVPRARQRYPSAQKCNRTREDHLAAHGGAKIVC